MEFIKIEKKRLFSFIGAIVIIVIFAFVYFYMGTDMSCVTVKQEEVKGSSMTGLIENGMNVTVYYGYYACNGLQRDDLVIYNFSGSKDPLLKRAVALGGDSFNLVKTGDNYSILINGKNLTTTTGELYSLPEKKYAMLNLYVVDYNQTIPQGTVLILGNQPQGTTDSTVFGLVSTKDLIGKAIIG